MSEHKAMARSAVTNGSRVLEGVDHRSTLARRFRDVLSEIVSDMGGHEAGLSEAQRQLARRVALLSVQCEQAEAQAIGGAEIDLEAYARWTNTIGRACARLGIKRQARPVEDLQTYMRQTYGDGKA